MLNKFLTALCGITIAIALLTAAIYAPATAEWVMRPLMERFAPPEVTYLPEAEYGPVVRMITGYLQGDDIPFQHVFAMNSTEYAAFNQKEQQHMADVRGLFLLCRTVGWTSLALSAVLAGSLALLRDQRAFVWFRRTLLAILAAVTVIVLLAMIDFDGLFILFHKAAFTNDLWLLNPQTDLLIRLMPIEFFVSYAAIIGGIWLAGMIIALAASILLQRFRKKGVTP